MEFERNTIIKDYPNYAISTLGHVLNIKTGRILKQHLSNKGYYYVNLSKNAFNKKCLIHRLMANSFLDNPQNKSWVDHINNIKSDNRLENLRYATEQENNRNRKISINNTSGSKGVMYRKNRKTWLATIMVDGKLINLGTFKNKEDAIAKRKNTALQLFGEFLNDCEK